MFLHSFYYKKKVKYRRWKKRLIPGKSEGFISKNEGGVKERFTFCAQCTLSDVNGLIIMNHTIDFTNQRITIASVPFFSLFALPCLH